MEMIVTDYDSQLLTESLIKNSWLPRFEIASSTYFEIAAKNYKISRESAANLLNAEVDLITLRGYNTHEYAFDRYIEPSRADEILDFPLNILTVSELAVLWEKVKQEYEFYKLLSSQSFKMCDSRHRKKADLSYETRSLDNVNGKSRDTANIMMAIIEEVSSRLTNQGQTLDVSRVFPLFTLGKGIEQIVSQSSRRVIATEASIYRGRQFRRKGLNFNDEL